MGRKRKQPGEDAEDLTSGNDPQEHLPPEMNPPPGAVVLVQATDDPGSFFVQLDLGAAVETEEHPATIIAVEHKYGLDVDMEGEGGGEEEKDQDQEEPEEEEEEEEEGEGEETEATTVESGVIDRAAIAAAMAPYPFLSVPEDPELARKGFAECTICAAKFRSGLAIKNPPKKPHPKTHLKTHKKCFFCFFLIINCL
jgi:hypothetical protein